jgi:hypothetical protein
VVSTTITLINAWVWLTSAKDARSADARGYHQWMRRRVGIAAGLGLVLARALACSSYAPHEVDASDAAAEASDAPRDDGSAAADADANADADAGPPPAFCASQPTPATFCCDFDLSKNVGDGWVQARAGADAGFTTELDHATFVTPPASAHLGVPAGTPDLWNKLIESPGATATASIRFEAKLRVDAVDAFSDLNVLELQAGFGAAFLRLSRSDATIQVDTFDDAGLSLPVAKLATLALGVWHHVEMAIAYGGASPMLTVKIDGISRLAGYALPAAFAANAPVGIEVGPAYYGAPVPVDAADVHVDDVLLDVR